MQQTAYVVPGINAQIVTKYAFKEIIMHHIMNLLLHCFTEMQQMNAYVAMHACMTTLFIFLVSTFSYFSRLCAGNGYYCYLSGYQ